MCGGLTLILQKSGTKELRNSPEYSTRQLVLLGGSCNLVSKVISALSYKYLLSIVALFITRFAKSHDP